MATNTEIAGLLGLSRAESVPNLTRRFDTWLATDGKLRRQLRSLEEELGSGDAIWDRGTPYATRG